jgi:hypothetical protein
VFTENLPGFLADFGVPVVLGGVSITAIFDQPGQDILSGRVQSEQYEITYVEAAAPGVLFGAVATIGGLSYTVLSTNSLDDGAFTRAVLDRN